MIRKRICKNVGLTERKELWEGRNFIGVFTKVDDAFGKDIADRIIDKLHSDMPFVERDKIRIRDIEFTYTIDE